MVGLSPSLFVAGHSWHQETVTEEEEDPTAAGGKSGGIVSGKASWGMAAVKGHCIHYSLLAAADLGKRESVCAV